MEKLIGSFVFRDNGDGCITAKWLNNSEAKAYPESSKLIDKEPSKNNFEGNYITTWIEGKGMVENSHLEIVKTNDTIYKLRWSGDTEDIFAGIAMLYEGLLIGSYWEVNS